MFFVKFGFCAEICSLTDFKSSLEPFLSILT